MSSNRLMLAVVAMLSVPLSPAAADVITDWDAVLTQAIRAETVHVGPTWSSRNSAMVHGAMYDAINSIDQTFAPLHFSLPDAPGTSREAAAAQAAHDVLLNLYPAQQTTFDTALTTSLALLPNSPGKTAGISLGAQAAASINLWRANDGANLPMPYNPVGGIGHWTPDPLHPDQMGLGAAWASVAPFVINNAAQFAPPLPPALDSAAYAAAYNEVKSLGAAGSLTRTADQTEISNFWAYDRGGMGPPTVLYNQILAKIGAQNGNTVSQNARLFALANVAMADAGIAAWQSKYADDLWRPITAIRAGDIDTNPLTDGDPDWMPLGAPGMGGDNFTPPFPAYVSGHATFGEALMHTLQQFYGTDTMHFELTSEEMPGVTRTFDSFSQASLENARSRIYMGVHWSFDDEQGRALGHSVAGFVFANALQPVPEPGSIMLLGVALAMCLSRTHTYCSRRRS